MCTIIGFLYDICSNFTAARVTPPVSCVDVFVFQTKELTYMGSSDIIMYNTENATLTVPVYIHIMDQYVTIKNTKIN